MASTKSNLKRWTVNQAKKEKENDQLNFNSNELIQKDRMSRKVARMPQVIKTEVADM